MAGYLHTEREVYLAYSFEERTLGSNSCTHLASGKLGSILLGRRGIYRRKMQLTGNQNETERPCCL